MLWQVEGVTRGLHDSPTNSLVGLAKHAGELGFTDRKDPNKRSVFKMNDILHRHVVRDRNGCVVHTFGCI